jgi:dUTP pyrophosphatase
MATTGEMPFQSAPPSEKNPLVQERYLDLAATTYLVEFNETVNVPLDVFGQIFPRSSMLRSGAIISSSLLDSGYCGVVGALLQVVNPKGIRLWENARLGQIVFHQMSESTDGYDGLYQGCEAL